ncbi:hypothetical protein [uncultured Erythrobacter sp.]|uniref:hypothetical protein n=1 Tax=uncultured Erythrobacter sp. TaxID=263913 RepID=UPI0026216D31|nr:hypothetical protein [uncultured Erythrobacter sp.]
MSNILELDARDITSVAGGNIVDELERRFPFGEWDGSSFCPYGCPKGDGTDGTEPY